MSNNVYTKVETAIRQYVTDIVLEKGTTPIEVRNAVHQIMRNNPDIFWFAHQYRYDEVASTIYFQYTFSPERIKIIQESINDVVGNDFYIEYVKGLSQQEQIAYIYKWLVKYCNYNVNSAYNQGIYSVFVRRNSVCTGYAKAAHYLFSLLGFESQLAFGRLNNDKEDGRHCWNIIQIEGQYYHFDVCLGDSVLDNVIKMAGVQVFHKIEGINYNFFCVSTDEILKTRSIENEESLPQCKSSLPQRLVEVLATISIKQREDVQGCLLTHIGSSADIYLCSKEKNTILKVFRPNCQITSGVEYRYMQQIKGCSHTLQCNEVYTDVRSNIIAIEQSTPIVDLLCSHYYELSLKGMLRMIMDIATAWTECEKCGVLYRDIHICNIYRCNNGIFKLGDFGSCTNDFMCKERVGNQWFMAPETFELGIFSESSAVYSISMVMYFILNNLRPAFWQQDGDNEALRKRMTGEELSLPIGCQHLPLDISDAVNAFFRRAVAPYPKNRLGSINDLIHELQQLLMLIGKRDCVIHRKGVSLDFNINADNENRLNAQWNYTSCDAYQRSAMDDEIGQMFTTVCSESQELDCNCLPKRSITKLECDGAIDINTNGNIDEKPLFVDDVESFARTMACTPTLSEESNALDVDRCECLVIEDGQRDMHGTEQEYSDSFFEAKESITYEPHYEKIEETSLHNSRIAYLEMLQKESETLLIYEEKKLQDLRKKIHASNNEENNKDVCYCPAPSRIPRSEVHRKKRIFSAFISFFASLINDSPAAISLDSTSTVDHSESRQNEQEKCRRERDELEYQKRKYENRISHIQNQIIEYKREIATLKEVDCYSNVYSSIFAPAEIKRKSHLLVQVYLHLSEESDKIQSLATESDKNAERRDYMPLQLKLKHGDKVDVELNVYGETLLMNVRKSVIWQGSFTKCSFGYFVPKDIDVDELSFEANFYVNKALIGNMRFITQIVSFPRNLNAKVLSDKFNQVFISYSHKDKERIEIIAKAYQAAGVNYFFDRHHLQVGDEWDSKILEHIDISDLFVLFWSQNAADSTYIPIEIERALSHAIPIETATLKIKPYILKPVDVLPSKLEKIHFEEL